MIDFSKHLIKESAIAIEALEIFNNLATDAILFLVDDNNVLKGSLTDGDIRRGLLKGLGVNDLVIKFIQTNPSFLKEYSIQIDKLIHFKKMGFKVIPIVNSYNQIVDILNFRTHKSYLPINILIMAGGEGKRLRPLTATIPKPLLPIGDKPILHILLNHFFSFKVKKCYLSINYLKNQIVESIAGHSFECDISYIYEDKPLGTIGSACNIDLLKEDIFLIINADILTNLNLEDFLFDFIESKADISIYTKSYLTEIPYGVVEIKENNVKSLKEKPTYTNQINSGIYLTKSSILNKIPKNEFYNMTDLVEACIRESFKVISYTSSDYWLDIGRIEDYNKAQIDIKHL